MLEKTNKEEKEPKEQISKPLFNSRIRTMARKALESYCHMEGIDFEKIGHKEQEFTEFLLKEQIEDKFDIIDPGDC